MRHLKVTRQCVALVLGLLAGSLPAGGQQAVCPELDVEAALRALDVPPPPDRESRPEYWSWSNGLTRRNLGIGFLDVQPSEPDLYADWLPAATLPLYWRPGDAEPAVWITRGWWVPVGRDDAERIPLTYRGMVETGYEVAGIIVLEERADGWLSLHVDIGPGPGRGVTSGVMWIPRCHLSAGSVVPFRYVPWTEVFGPDGPGGISFRDGERHALRAAPAPDGPRLEWVQPDDEVEILELRGDWARVRTSRPGRYLTGCLGEEWNGHAREGWVRWRDAERGPRIWYPTRGC